jgi:hypothetical protein
VEVSRIKKITTLKKKKGKKVGGDQEKPSGKRKIKDR